MGLWDAKRSRVLVERSAKVSFTLLFKKSITGAHGMALYMHKTTSLLAECADFVHR